jgi:hypothetical protein
VLNPQVKASETALRTEVAEFKKLKAEYKAKEQQKKLILSNQQLDTLKDENGKDMRINTGEIDTIASMLELYKSNVELRKDIKTSQDVHKSKKEQRVKLKEKNKSLQKKIDGMKEEGSTADDIAEVQAEIDAIKPEESKVSTRFHVDSMLIPC